MRFTSHCFLLYKEIIFDISFYPFQWNPDATAGNVLKIFFCGE